MQSWILHVTTKFDAHRKVGAHFRKGLWWTDLCLILVILSSSYLIVSAVERNSLWVHPSMCFMMSSAQGWQAFSSSSTRGKTQDWKKQAQSSHFLVTLAGGPWRRVTKKKKITLYTTVKRAFAGKWGCEGLANWNFPSVSFHCPVHPCQPPASCFGIDPRSHTKNHIAVVKCDTWWSEIDQLFFSGKYSSILQVSCISSNPKALVVTN